MTKSRPNLFEIDAKCVDDMVYKEDHREGDAEGEIHIVLQGEKGMF